MEPVLFVLALVAAGAVAWWQWHRQAKRREELHALAVTRGLTWTRHDHVGIPARHPFRFWNEGDERTWKNVISGALDGRPLLLFDFEYVEIRRDSEGRRQRTTYRHSCAIAQLDGAFTPGLQLEPETMFSRLKDKAGFRDLELESEEFNRRFEVGTRNRKFAVAFLDARMMNWLLSTPTGMRFEVLGNHVLVADRQRDADELLLLHHIATDFAGRMPDVVRSLYPLD